MHIGDMKQCATQNSKMVKRHQYVGHEVPFKRRRASKRLSIYKEPMQWRSSKYGVNTDGPIKTIKQGLNINLCSDEK